MNGVQCLGLTITSQAAVFHGRGRIEERLAQQRDSVHWFGPSRSGSIPKMHPVSGANRA